MKNIAVVSFLTQFKTLKVSMTWNAGGSETVSEITVFVFLLSDNSWIFLEMQRAVLTGWLRWKHLAAGLRRQVKCENQMSRRLPILPPDSTAGSSVDPKGIQPTPQLSLHDTRTLPTIVTTRSTFRAQEDAAFANTGPPMDVGTFLKRNRATE